MRKLSTLAAFLVMACGPAQAPPPQSDVAPAPVQAHASAGSPARATGDLVIRLEDAQMQALIAADTETRPAQAAEALQRLAPSTAGLEIARVTAGGDLVLRGAVTPERVAAIEAEPSVTFVQPDQVMQHQ